MYVTFDRVPIDLPTPLDQLVLTHPSRRRQASYHAHPDRWLFPGGIPGRHLHTESILSQLVARGIHPSASRHAAMYQLAGSVPMPVLAELLHISPNAATGGPT